MLNNLFGIKRNSTDLGIIDGQVKLVDEDQDVTPHLTKEIPSGPAPVAIKYKRKIYGDTKSYNENGFRVYQENFNIYKHTGSE